MIHLTAYFAVGLLIGAVIVYAASKFAEVLMLRRDRRPW